MDTGVQEAKGVNQEGHGAVSCTGARARRKPAGRKPNPSAQPGTIAAALKGFISGHFPELVGWLKGLPDARVQVMCVYSGAHIWMQIIYLFLTRAGSRNAFDPMRNTGLLPKGFAALCEQFADDERFEGAPRVTSGDNAARHASRTDAAKVALIPAMMIRKLLASRTLEAGRLFGQWYVIVVDGTVQEKCRTGFEDGLSRGDARYRYVIQACILCNGIRLPFLHEAVDVHDALRDKQDCELKAFSRLAVNIKASFPKLPIIIVGDALYGCATVADICGQNQWKYLLCLKEGRQPLLWEEVLDLLPITRASHLRIHAGTGDMAPLHDFRWVQDLPFGKSTAAVILEGDITKDSATLYAWITNMHRLTDERIPELCAVTGRERHCIEDHFNTQKNNGPGLGHVFCANQTASKNYYSMMQCAQIIWELFYHGHLARLYGWARQTTQKALAMMIADGMRSFDLPADCPPIRQLRFVT